MDRAIEALKTAETLFVHCGAGMSSDAGIPTYVSMGAQYETLCSMRLLEDPELFFGYWGSTLHAARDAEPHTGHWALAAWAKAKKASICTTNIDGLLSKVGIEAAEIHGSIEWWTCTQGCGVPTMAPEWLRFDVDDEFMRVYEEENEYAPRGYAASPGSVSFACSHPRCTQCHAYARPCVAMFGDLAFSPPDSGPLDRYYAARACALERATPIAVLEIGAGDRLPTLRHKTETLALHAQGPCTRVRVNTNTRGLEGILLQGRAVDVLPQLMHDVAAQNVPLGCPDGDGDCTAGPPHECGQSLV